MYPKKTKTFCRSMYSDETAETNDTRTAAPPRFPRGAFAAATYTRGQAFGEARWWQHKPWACYSGLVA